MAEAADNIQEPRPKRPRLATRSLNWPRSSSAQLSDESGLDEEPSQMLKELSDAEARAAKAQSDFNRLRDKLRVREDRLSGINDERQRLSEELRLARAELQAVRPRDRPMSERLSELSKMSKRLVETESLRKFLESKVEQLRGKELPLRDRWLGRDERERQRLAKELQAVRGELKVAKQQAATQKKQAATQKKQAATQKKQSATQKKQAATQKKQAATQKKQAATQKRATIQKQPQGLAEICSQATRPFSMERLPAEVLTRVFAMLDQTSRSRCAQVSQRWQELAMQPLLWRSLRIHYGGWRSVVTADLLSRLSNWLSDSLLELDFRVANARLDILLPLLTESSKLRSLTVMWRCRSNDVENPLSILGRCCSDLRSLRLLECKTDALTADSLAQLQAGCPRLSHLEISSRDGYSPWGNSMALLAPQSAAHLAALVGRLTSLSLNNRHLLEPILPELPERLQLTSLTLQRISESDLLRLLPRLPRLTELTLKNCNFTDNVACSLAAACRGLRSLRLTGCRSEPLTSDGIVALLAGCPKLRCLDLLGCQSLSGFHYRRVGGSLPLDIEELRLPCASLTAEELETRLPLELKRLELRLSYVCDGLRGLPTACPGLTHLALNDCPDELLPALISQLPSLRCLRLNDCHCLTRQTFAKLRGLTACPPDLQEFVALGSAKSSVTDQAVAVLCSSPLAPGLQRLCLSDTSCAPRATAESLAALARSCPRLTQLSLRVKHNSCEVDLQRLFHAAFQYHVELEFRQVAQWAKDGW